MAETAQPTPNQKLRYERERRGWSQQDVADKVGTTPLNVGRWERGITQPGPHFRQQLCQVFEKSLQELGLLPEHASDGKSTERRIPVDPLPEPPEPPPAASLWNVPYRRNPFFTGREDILIQLREALIFTEHPIALPQPQAISGLGGIGKTQIVIEYAHRYRDGYSAVLWARADSYETLASDYLLLAALLNLPQRNEQDQSMVINAVKGWFDTHEGWLLILDNADNLQVVEEFLPAASKGHVLLTTRSHSTGTVAQRIELENMGLDEGILLLLRRAKLLKGNFSFANVPNALQKQAQTIVEAVDGLPLAIDQAAAYIEETGCSLSDYLKFYRTRRQRLLRSRGKDAGGHPEPVATTWSLSFEKVEQANPAAAELLRLCAFLHPDEIPETMIMEGAAELGPVLQPVAEDELDLNEAIGELHRYSLIKRDTEKKILNMHRLVQVVIRGGMDQETQQEWAERVVRIVNHIFPNIRIPILDVASVSTCQQLLPHARVCANLIVESGMTFIEAASLLSNLGLFLLHRGQYSDAEMMLQKTLTIREQISGPNDLDVARTLNDLGLLSKEQGKYELAISLFQRALSIREQLLGPEHFDVARTLNNLAVIYMTEGKYELAEQFYQRCLDISEHIYGSNHINVTVTLNNIAALYAYQGKFELARPVFQRVLSIREQALGPNHPSVARSIFNLAKVCQDQQQYDEAEPLHRRALAIRESELGPEHPDVAQSLNELAALYVATGRYQEAEALLLRAITIREQSLGSNHPEFAETLYHLASLHYEQARYEQAEILFQRALAIFEKNFGPEHPLTARILETYANLLHRTGRESEAAALEQRAQAMRAKQA